MLVYSSNILPPLKQVGLFNSYWVSVCVCLKDFVHFCCQAVHCNHYPLIAINWEIFVCIISLPFKFSHASFIAITSAGNGCTWCDTLFWCAHPVYSSTCIHSWLVSAGFSSYIVTNDFVGTQCSTLARNRWSFEIALKCLRIILLTAKMVWRFLYCLQRNL